ncbi:MAG: hypothetical protein WCY37_02235 [Candidatus Dojkabacteria bacterium]
MFQANVFRDLASVEMESFGEIYELFPDQRDSLYYKGCYGQKAYNRFLKDISFVDCPCGSDISDITEEMVSRAEKFQVRTYTYFNDVYIICRPGKDTSESLVETYLQKTDEDSEKYHRSFRYKLFEREMEEKKKATLNQEIISLGGD